LAAVVHQAIIKGKKIRSLQWHNEYVIYECLSGDTHLLDEISGEVICSLSEQAMSMTEITKKLNGLFEDSSELAVESYLVDFIAKFKSLGLLDIE
jgi:PqqD family protein of HPr-rel-A system